MELDKSWASVTHQDHRGFSKHKGDKTNSTPQQHRQRFKPMWLVREHMAFLIRNLQFYIQVINARESSLTYYFLSFYVVELQLACKNTDAFTWMIV